MLDVAWKLLHEDVYELHQHGFLTSFPGTQYLHTMTKQVLRGVTQEELRETYQIIKSVLDAQDGEQDIPGPTRLAMAIDYHGFSPELVVRCFGCMALYKLAIATVVCETSEPESGGSGLALAALHQGLLALCEAAFRSAPIDEVEFESIWDAGGKNAVKDRQSKAASSGKYDFIWLKLKRLIEVEYQTPERFHHKPSVVAGDFYESMLSDPEGWRVPRRKSGNYDFPDRRYFNRKAKEYSPEDVRKKDDRGRPKSK